jgi:signal transduction histidine kinase
VTQVEQTLENYRRILEISKQLNSNLEYRTLLHQIVTIVVEILNVEASSIMLLDPGSGELRFEIASNMKAHETENIAVPLEKSIAGWIVTHGEPRVIKDVAQEPIHFRQVDKEMHFKTRNLLGVPLITHDKVIGVLQAVNKRGENGFTSEDINQLTILASQAAVAIENARLFQQSDFIAEIVHELRTPLAALKASTSLLRRDDLDAERRNQVLRLVDEETDRLIALSTDFLDLARLESGRIGLVFGKVSLEELVSDCVAIVQPQSDAKDISITLDLPEIVINGDKTKLKQVLLNLLTNAIKYNRHQGRIHISAASHDGDMVRIEVSDSGYGISSEHLPSLFRKFYRVPEHQNRASGTGLGLAISKSIVELHGGAIWVHSIAEKGSIFSFTVPVFS